MFQIVCYNYTGNIQNHDHQTFNTASIGRPILKSDIYMHNMNLL